MDCLQANHSGLKQKSDIEHYRNKLRQKARRKGYGEFSLSETGSHGYSHHDARHNRHDNGVKEPMTAEEKRASFAGCHKRYGEDFAGVQRYQDIQMLAAVGQNLTKCSDSCIKMFNKIKGLDFTIKAESDFIIGTYEMNLFLFHFISSVFRTSSGRMNLSVMRLFYECMIFC